MWPLWLCRNSSAVARVAERFRYTDHAAALSVPCSLTPAWRRPAGTLLRSTKSSAFLSKPSLPCCSPFRYCTEGRSEVMGAETQGSQGGGEARVRPRVWSIPTTSRQWVVGEAAPSSSLLPRPLCRAFCLACPLALQTALADVPARAAQHCMSWVLARRGGLWLSCGTSTS